MRQVLPLMTYISVSDSFVMSRVHDVLTLETPSGPERELLLSSAESLNAISILCKHVSFFGAELTFYINHIVDEGTLTILSHLNYTNVNKVCVYGTHCRGKPDKTEHKVMSLFAHLQHLSFTNIKFNKVEISHLSEASRVGHVPFLTHLSFRYCDGLESNLSLLFNEPWSQLTHLEFLQKNLNASDLRVIGNMQDNKLPKLLFLILHIPKYPYTGDTDRIHRPLIINYLKERFTSL